MVSAVSLAIILTSASTPSEEMARAAIGVCPDLIESGSAASVSVDVLQEFGVDQIEFIRPTTPDDPIVSLESVSDPVWVLDHHWSATSGVAICTLHGPGSDQDVLRVAHVIEAQGWQPLGHVGRLWQWRSSDERYLLNVQQGDLKVMIMSVLHPLRQD